MSIELKGLNSLVASFDKDAKLAVGEARKAVRAVALNTERDAKIFAPVDTGALRNSISTTISGNATFSQAEVGPTVEYGLYVEEGTSRTAPQAYMGPAFNRNAHTFVSAIEAITGKLQ